MTLQPPKQGKKKYSLNYMVAAEYVAMGVLADEAKTTSNSYHNSVTEYPHSGVGKKRELPLSDTESCTDRPSRKCRFADSVLVTPFDMTNEPSSVTPLDTTDEPSSVTPLDTTDEPSSVTPLDTTDEQSSVETPPPYDEPINDDNTSSPHSKAKNALLQKFKLERKMNKDQVTALLLTFMTEDMDRGEYAAKVVDALTLIHSMLDQNKQVKILLPNGCGTPIAPLFKNAIQFLVSAVCEFGGIPVPKLSKAPSPGAPLSKAPSPGAPLSKAPSPGAPLSKAPSNTTAVSLPVHAV